MEGWRAKVGILIPAANAVMEPDFNRLAQNGIAIYASRVGRQSPNVTVESQIEMLDHLDSAATLLAAAGMDLMVFGCTSASFVRGVGGDAEIAERIERLTGVPAITTSTAVMEALRQLRVKTISIFSPYLDEVNEREAEFFRGNGFEVLGIKGMQFQASAQNRSFPTEQIYREARKADSPDSEALFISCTNFRALGAIELLERDLGKPVVTSNQASFWYALKALKLREPREGYGQLLR
ncbi:MAG: maleate cis-trans isomerase family protein [Chloroflexota bacterium]